MLSAPFPWFGGKKMAADFIWHALGNDIKHYVEPFGGSYAILLARPNVSGTEVVNDLDCYLVNFWRAVQRNPVEVAEHSGGLISEVDLISRHNWLLSQNDFRGRMLVDPDYCDSKIAGWWVWGLSAWIGSGWCKVGSKTYQKLPDLVSNRGVFRADLETIEQRVKYFKQLQTRLQHVRIACGEWERVLSMSALRQCPTHKGITAVVLDPPYQDGCANYAAGQSEGLSKRVAARAVELGSNKNIRVVLCGLAGEHEMPADWTIVDWHSSGGFARINRNDTNRKRERIWLSPGCLKFASERLNGSKDRQIQTQEIQSAC